MLSDWQTGVTHVGARSLGLFAHRGWSPWLSFPACLYPLLFVIWRVYSTSEPVACMRSVLIWYQGRFFDLRASWMHTFRPTVRGWGMTWFCMKCKHEGLSLISRSCVQRTGCGGVCWRVQHWGGGARWIPETHWTASLSYLASSRPVGDSFPKTHNSS